MTCAAGALPLAASGSEQPAEPVETAADSGRPAAGRLVTASFGVDSGAGNLLGIQPWLEPRDYSRSTNLAAKLRGYLADCRERGWLGPKTVVVLPEYIGTWLVAEGEAASVVEAPTIGEAMQALVLRHFGSFLLQVPWAPAKDRVRHALFALKAASIAQSFDTVFSGLAREFGVTVVAGSVLLPDPRVEAGRLRTGGSGPLFNTSVVYGPSGEAIGPPVRKVFLIGDEQPFVGAGSVDALPIVSTPAGRLAVLICADSWYPACYRLLARDRADLVAVPS